MSRELQTLTKNTSDHGNSSPPPAHGDNRMTNAIVPVPRYNKVDGALVLTDGGLVADVLKEDIKGL